MREEERGKKDEGCERVKRGRKGRKYTVKDSRMDSYNIIGDV